MSCSLKENMECPSSSELLKFSCNTWIGHWASSAVAYVHYIQFMIYGWYHLNNPWTGPHVVDPHQLSPTQLSCAPVINFLVTANSTKLSIKLMIHGWYHLNNPWTGPHVDNPHQLSPTQLSCAPVINFLVTANSTILSIKLMIHGWYHLNNPWTGPHVDNPHQLSPTQLSCAPVINFLIYSKVNQTIPLETELTLYGDLQPNSSCAAGVKTLRRSSTKTLLLPPELNLKSESNQTLLLHPELKSW